MPEFVAAAAVNSLNLGGVYAGSMAATVVYGATYIGTVAAISYGTSAIAADLNSRDDPGSLLEIQVASDSPRQIVIGERITGGSLVGRYVTGPGNNNLIEVLALADHRVEACLSWYVGGIETLNNLTHGSRTSVPAYRSSTDRLWVTWYDGRHEQTADANLTGRTLTNQPDWTSNHRGRGVSYAIVEMQWDDDVMLSPVTSQFLLRGGRFYDRRLDDTAGGTGDHRHTDPDTWEYTTNPDVVADHYQLGIVPYPDAPLYSWGIGLKTWQLPYDLFKEEADISDEQVLMKDGVTYQDRYALNAIFSASNTHREILTQIAKAKAGRVVDRGGRLALIGPQARTPVMTLYDADLIGGEQSKYSDKLSISDVYNTFEGRFPDPLQMFRPVDYPRLTDAAWKAADGGDELTETVDIEVDTDEERVQRLVWLYAMDKRRQARLTEAYGPQAIEIEDGDWFERISTRFPDGKLFEAIRVEHTISAEKGFFVVIHSKEVDPDDVAWSEDMAADLSRPPPVSQAASFANFVEPELVVSPVDVSGGGAILPAIGIVISNADDSRIRSALIEVIPDGGGPIIQRVIEAGPDSTNAVTIDEGILPAADYVVRARFQGLIKPSAWSDNYDVTSGADYIVGEAQFVEWENVENGSGTRPDDNADVTIENTAAAFTGQGALAILGFVTFGGNVRRSDGTTLATDGDYRTLLGTAAAITAQGTLATLNQAAWASNISGRPTELTDGRVGAGLDASGYISAGLSAAFSPKYMLDALAGVSIAKNPEFTNSTTGWAVYNNAGGSKVTMNLETDNTAPNSSRKRIAIAYDGSGTYNSNPTPGFGGVYQTLAPSADGVASRPGYYAKNSRILYRIKAAIPVGRNIAFASNNLGDGYTFTWLTSRAGTGTWETYVGVIQIGSSGIFADTGYLYITDGANSAFTWYIARFDQVDLSGSYRSYIGAGLIDTDGTPRFNVDLITSLGTASAFTGQGALATLSSLAYGGGYLTGFGALAAKATIDSSGLVGAGVIVYTSLAATAVRLGLNITRSDGSTALTDALAVTSLGVASAIASQGALATLSQFASSNIARNTEFALSTNGWTALQAGSGSPDPVLDIENDFESGSTRKILHWRKNGGGFVSSGNVYLGNVYAKLGDRSDGHFTCAAGERFYIALDYAYWTGGVVSHAYTYVQWFDSAGSPISYDSVANIAPAAGYTWARGAAVKTAPAGASYFAIYVDMYHIGSTTTGINREAWFRKPQVVRLAAGQVDAPYAPGLDSYRGADVTAINTAAAITSQGGLATANTIATDAQLSGQIASRLTPAGVDPNYLQAGRIAWSAGATVESLKPGEIGANVTETRVAASITAQGILATSALSVVQVRNDALANSLSPDPSFLDSESVQNNGGGGTANSYFSQVTVTDCPAGPKALQTASHASLLWYPHQKKFVIDRTRVYEASLYVKGVSGDGTFYALCRFLDEAGNLITGDPLSGWPQSYPAGGNYYWGVSTPAPASWERRSIVFGAAGATVPANAVYCVIACLFNWTASAPGPTQLSGVRCEELRRIGTNLYRADGTVASEAQLVTSLGTAGAISGQGGLATLSFVTISTNLRLADGTTVATTAMVVTASGTASAIASQGALATLNDAGVFGYATPSAGNITSSYVSKASKSVTTDGGVVEIWFSGSFEVLYPLVNLSGQTLVNVQCKIKRDSTELIADFVLCGWLYDDGALKQFTKLPGWAMILDQPSAGTYTYSIELKCNVGGSDSGLYAAQLLSGGNVFRVVNPIGAANAVSAP